MNTLSKTTLGEKMSDKDLTPSQLLGGQEAAYARDVERLLKRASEFVTVSCPACNESSSMPAFEKYGCKFSSCQRCRTIYMNPRPSPAAMADYYAHSENYAYYASVIFPATEESRREKIHKPWLERIVGFCDRYEVKRGRLLEVGPGFGTFAETATKSGFFQSVLAIEPTPEMASSCRKRGVNVIEKRIEDATNLDPVDVVVSFEVIEHLFEPAGFVRQCAKLIRPGGLLVLTCPNGLGFDVAMLREKSFAVDTEHVNLFNPHSLSRLLEENAFQVLEATTPGRLDAEMVRDVAVRGELTLDPFMQRVLVEEWERLGWPFQQFLASNNLSSHMWIVGRKND